MADERGAVLLRWSPIFVPSGPSFFADYSVGIYMMEQLIAAGFYEVVTDDPVFSSEEAKNRIAPILTKRLSIVDSQKSLNLAQAVLASVFGEFGLAATHRGLLSAAVPRGSTDRLEGQLRYPPNQEQLALLKAGQFTEQQEQELLRDAAATLYFSLPDFLLACENQLHLDFPLADVQTSVDVLLSQARDPNSRGILATLAGVFRSYRPMRIESLELRSVMNSEAYERFIDLIEDELYLRMSNAGWRMGVPAHLRCAATAFGKYARRIARSRAFKPIANLTSKALSAAVHVPVPDSDLGSLILKQGYMPPILQLDHLHAEAKATHLRLCPPLLNPLTH